MNKFQILVVEDDPPIRNLIATTLKTHEYKYLLAKNGEEAILQASSYAPDVVFLDLGLPDIDGIEIIKRIRERSNMPIIVISARSEDEDKIEALDAGADDYLTKPFSCAELLGRIKALIRRYRKYNQSWKCPSIESHIIHSGNILVNEEKGTVSINGKEINLTSIEFQLLLLFIKHPGRIYPTQVLYEQIWNEPYFYSCNGTVMVHIRKLRKKIEETPSNPCLIQTVWGKGYKFHEENQ